MDKTKEQEEKQVDSETVAGDTRKNEYEKENFVPIQEYTGEGFKLRDSREENLEIAEKYQDEVEEAVKQFFLVEYKSEVKVHNMVAAVDGVTVYVESIGEPHFYTFAVVPVDSKNEVVRTDSVWSLEGEVETGITGGLYAMAYDKEFSNLDQYLEETTETYPIVGTPIVAIENVMATGYTTPYYFFSPVGDVFDKLFLEYMNNPEITADEIKDFLAKNPFDPMYVIFGIEFYMEEENSEPKQEILDSIASDIESLENIPRGEYNISLNDNYIDKKRGVGQKDNTIDRSDPNAIMKE
ncbi:DUF1672 family protein [Paucisalibacillus globulus]|uniref:DUF1672 family protein n=1 Tax=Paucisalibacillus globulus TaxID=351095 RepID=UPI00146FA070|nr:DUF1672 family protein [Paucisalibacillus globulus]